MTKTTIRERYLRRALDLAKKACDRFDGFAQVGGSNYAFVDLTKYEVTLK